MAWERLQAERLSLVGAAGGQRVPISRYVERAGVEAALVTAIDTARAVAVVGGAGSGKTRVVDHVLRSRPRAVASAASAYNPSARSILADLLLSAPGEEVPIAQVLRGRTAVPPDAVAERGLHFAAGQALSRRTGDSILVVEDAELLGPTEVDLLAQAIKGSSNHWVLVTRRALALPEVPIVEVGELTHAEGAALLRQRLPALRSDQAQAIVHQVGGLPIDLEHCALFLAESSDTAHADPDLARVASAGAEDSASSMHDFIVRRLELLPRSDRIVIEVAAILGERPDSDVLDHLVNDRDAIDRLVGRGLLRRAGSAVGPAALRFGHSLVRETAYALAPTARKVAVHRAAAEWYAALPASEVLEVQAHHLEAIVGLGEADCEGVRRAVEALTLFARSIEVERTRQAADTLRRARAIADTRPECAADILELELAWATTSEALGDFGEAIRSARRAHRLARDRGARPALAQALTLQGRLLRLAEDADGTSLLDEAELIFSELNDRSGQARVQSSRAFVAVSDDGLVDYLRHEENAYRMAVRAGDRRMQSASAQSLAIHHAGVTGRTQALDWARVALDVSRQDDLAVRPRVDLAEAALAAYGCDPAEGSPAAERALAAARELGLLHVQSNALVMGMILHLQDGQVRAAQELLTEARSIEPRRGSAWWSGLVDLLEARVLSAHGEVERADLLLERVARNDAASGASLQQNLAETRATLALRRGRFEESRAHSLEAALLCDRLGERVPGLLPRLLAVVASIADEQPLALGDIADLKAASRDTGLAAIAEIASRWLLVDELINGWTVDLHGLTPVPGSVDIAALDLEIEALRTRRWDGLIEAAETWGRLGAIVWQPRDLIWHSELTGVPHPEAAEMLETLRSPDGIEEHFRAQVRALKE